MKKPTRLFISQSAIGVIALMTASRPLWNVYSA